MGLLRTLYALYELAVSYRPRVLVRYFARSERTAPDGYPIPPLPYIVSAVCVPDVPYYLQTGRLAAAGIQDVLARHGTQVRELSTILDFGCGCGRVIRWWTSLRSTLLFGSDYNVRHVRWCQRHLPFARVEANHPMPPLRYGEEQFDLVYALSVLTHLPEGMQHPWVAELRRVLRPGGHLVISTHGRHFIGRLTPHERQRFDSGRLVVRNSDAAGTNLCCAFHPESYVRNTLSDGLTMVECALHGAAGNPCQDLYLLQKPVC
jgi:SAM-dependent methyltransferase